MLFCSALVSGASFIFFLTILQIYAALHAATAEEISTEFFKVTVNKRVYMMSKLIKYINIKFRLIPTPENHHIYSKTKIIWSVNWGFYGAKLQSFMVRN